MVSFAGADATSASLRSKPAAPGLGRLLVDELSADLAASGAKLALVEVLRVLVLGLGQRVEVEVEILSRRALGVLDVDVDLEAGIRQGGAAAWRLGQRGCRRRHGRLETSRYEPGQGRRRRRRERWRRCDGRRRRGHCAWGQQRGCGRDRLRCGRGHRRARPRVRLLVDPGSPGGVALEAQHLREHA